MVYKLPSCGPGFRDQTQAVGGRGWCLQEGAAASSLYGISNGNVVSIQQLAKEQDVRLCKLDLSLYYRAGNAAEILNRMDRRKTTRTEDMSYALTGIFSIHLPLAYGEGKRSRERLLLELATRKGDLSFLSFPSTKMNIGAYLPVSGHTYFTVADCATASTPAMVSHFGITVQVELLSGLDIEKALKALTGLKNMKMYSKGRYMGIAELLKQVQKSEIKPASTLGISIIRDIRSIMLIETHGNDIMTAGSIAIKCCHRLQCCQVETNEFERLFKSIGTKSERIWLGSKPLARTRVRG